MILWEHGEKNCLLFKICFRKKFNVENWSWNRKIVSCLHIIWFFFFILLIIGCGVAAWVRSFYDFVWCIFPFWLWCWIDINSLLFYAYCNSVPVFSSFCFCSRRWFVSYQRTSVAAYGTVSGLPWGLARMKQSWLQLLPSLERTHGRCTCENDLRLHQW